MLKSLSKVLLVLLVSVLFAGRFFGLSPTDAQMSPVEHVYYGYVPPSTDVASYETIEEFDRPAYGEVDELTKGTLINYTVPPGHAVLDVVGLEDGTNLEVWDIYAGKMIESGTVDRFEKKVFYIAYGTFFKIASAKRVAALLCGGQSVFEPSASVGGTSAFYPSVTGGFRGTEFVFNPAPGTHPTAHYDWVGYNFYLMALEETDWSLSDSIGVWSANGHLAQRGTRIMMLQTRKHLLEYHNGVGSDVVFHLTTSNDVEVSCCALGDFLAVPAITGGYAGRLFYAPVAVTIEEAGRTAACLAIPIEPGQVTIYNQNLGVTASRSFAENAIAEMDYWYHELGSGRFNLIAESTGDMVFMVGQTAGTAEIDYFGDDITFIGSRPGQEIRFYVPTMAVIFAPETSTITIDGAAPTQMLKDDFRLLDSGIHSVSADKHIIVEVLAAGPGWDNWGSYLIEPSDVDTSFEAPEGFVSQAADYTMYIAGAAAVVALTAVALLIMRRRGASRS